VPRVVDVPISGGGADPPPRGAPTGRLPGTCDVCTLALDAPRPLPRRGSGEVACNGPRRRRIRSSSSSPGPSRAASASCAGWTGRWPTSTRRPSPAWLRTSSGGSRPASWRTAWPSPRRSRRRSFCGTGARNAGPSKRHDAGSRRPRSSPTPTWPTVTPRSRRRRSRTPSVDAAPTPVTSSPAAPSSGGSRTRECSGSPSAPSPPPCSRTPCSPSATAPSLAAASGSSGG
jgi:hypothetical protein